ncbi:MAG: phage tail assembly protein [Methanosarcinaceae archaeon]
MRLATAADEILPLRDPKVRSNPAYLTVILLSRVITKLGTLESIDNSKVEKLFASDLAYLQDLYSKINENGAIKRTATCPECGHQFEFEEESQGE